MRLFELTINGLIQTINLDAIESFVDDSFMGSVHLTLMSGKTFIITGMTSAQLRAIVDQALKQSAAP